MNAALVTGGSHRLGRSVAIHLAQSGKKVVVHCNRSVDAAAALVHELNASGKTAFVVEGDLSDEHSVEGVMLEANRLTGGVDILINNASIFNDDTVLDFEFGRLMENMMVNAYAPLLLSRRFARMTSKGCIVNFLDSRVVDYDAIHASYHLSKRALDALTKMLAVELAPHIRVNAVAPGLILPPEGKGEAYVEMRKKELPLQRQGTLAEIDMTVDFFLRNAFVTGQTIFVDGGRHLKGAFYS